MIRFGKKDPEGDKFVDRRSDYAEFSDLTVGDYASGMPNIKIGEMISSFMRQLRWMLPLFLIGAILIIFLTKNIKRDYQGQGQILVQMGEEYQYNPVTGSSPQGGMLVTPEYITSNEISIMTNAEVIERVIGQMVTEFGEQRFAKSAYEKINKAQQSGNTIELVNARVELSQAISKSFETKAPPKSSVIDLKFKHEDGDVAVATLNAFIDAYMNYRRTVFVEGSADTISERRKATEEQLMSNEKEIQTFLEKNQIADFESERVGAATRTEALRAQLNDIEGEITETEAALASVEDQLRQTPEEINQYTDDRLAQRIAQAELEKKTLLARYLPNSDPVINKQAEIDQYKALQNSHSGAAVGGRRVGPNPVYQELMTRRHLLQSTADSLREKEFAIQAQLRSADTKVQKFTKLDPVYRALLRERSTLDQRHRGYVTKEHEAEINQRQAEANSENVKVISYATLPRKGRNMKMIIRLLACVAWLFTLFMLALLRVFLDPKLYTKPVRGYGRRRSDGTPVEPQMPASRRPEDFVTAQKHVRPNTPYVPEAVPAPAHAAAHATYVASAPEAPPPPHAEIFAEVPGGIGYYPYSTPQDNRAYDVAHNPYAQQVHPTPPNPHVSEPADMGKVPASEQD